MLVHEICGNKSSLSTKIVEFTVSTKLLDFSAECIVLELYCIALVANQKCGLNFLIFLWIPKTIFFAFVKCILNLFDKLFKKLIQPKLVSESFWKFYDVFK